MRDDGFHEIETILQQIDLKDEIEVTSTEYPQIEFSCNHPDLQEADLNLCVRAANLLKKSTGIQKGAQIHLNKTIPMGAGLGGGSSNAALVLLCLNKLWGLNLSAKGLQVIASQLGSDIPFFILLCLSTHIPQAYTLFIKILRIGYLFTRSIVKLYGFRTPLCNA